jgi:exonuclease VII small subunit
MPNPKDGLTLEGLARILRDHMNGTALQFSEVRRQFSDVGTRIDDLRRENAEVAGMIRDLSQVVLRPVDEVAEHRRLHEQHRQEIRQIFSRMERGDARFEEMNREFRARMAEHDARFEAMSREIRQILDALQRRGGDGGGAQT